MAFGAVSELRPFETFVVRLMRAPAGEIRGLVHNVRTGEKLPFDGLAGLGEALVHLAGRDEAP
jgi:hypothetical protein